MNTSSTQKGVALLTVLLIGSIMLLVSVSMVVFALKAVRSAHVRSDSMGSVYTAEAAFNCIKYWLKQNEKNFGAGHNVHVSGLYYEGTPTFPELVDSAGNIASKGCNGGPPYNFTTAVDSDGYYLDTDSGSMHTRTYYLTVPTNRGEVEVEIERDRTVGWFRGTTTVRGFSMDPTSNKVVQREQAYFFEWPKRANADVMFVVDRSGSITGNRTSGSFSGEWADLMDALKNSADYLTVLGSPIHLGFVSFGTDYNDVGNQVNIGGCTNCALTPEIRVGGVADSDGDGYPDIKTAINHTNTSLGLAVAGAELMARYYPIGSVAGMEPVTSSEAGYFEKIVATNGSFTGLTPDSGSGDRVDSDYPDSIILITDGVPNAFMSFKTQSYHVLRYNTLTDTEPTIGGTGAYGPSIVKLFDTGDPGLGWLLDDGTYTNSVAPYYTACNDDEATYPSSEIGLSNMSPHQAWCNAAQIAEKLKNDENVQIAVIGVGVGSYPNAEDFLRNNIASDPSYYQTATGYADLSSAIQIVIEELQLTEFR